MNNKRRATLFALALIALLTIAPELSLAQSTPDVPASTFTARTELVLVPVLVRDHSGKAVTGLKKGQFTVQDEGKSRKLSIFEEITTTTASTRLKQQNTNEFSNYVADPHSPRRVTIILLDLLTTPTVEQPRARQAVLDFLARGLSPSEPTTLLVLSRAGIQQIHSFTTNTQVLIDSVRRARGASAGEWQTTADGTLPVASLDGDDSAREFISIRNVLAQANQDFDNLRHNATQYDILREFELLSQAYAGVPGRKALVWVTGGFKYPNGDTLADKMMRERVERIWKMLNGSNIAVYPIDVLGLVAPIIGPAPGQGIPDPRTSPPQIRTLDVRREYHDTFKLFSEATGGRPCINNNDITNCLERASKDLESYYVLGFYVPVNERKPGWHKLKVKVNADYADLRFREGYLVEEQGRPSLPEDKASLAFAFASPLDFTAVQLQAAITGVQPAGDERQVAYEIRLPANSFFIDHENNNRAELQFSAEAFDSNNKSVCEDSKLLKGNLLPKTVKLITSEGLTHKGDLRLKPGNYRLKFIVRDNLTGNIGSVTAPLDVK